MVVPREEWGWTGWAGPVHEVPMRERTTFVVHWDGAHPVADLGPATLRRIDRTHRRQKGWAGIGYNFVVDRAARAWEGRGWDLVGAHCPGQNRTGIGVQVAVGAGQAPTAGMLAAVRDLYGEACRRAGHPLAWSWHGAHYPTECPGPILTLWARTQPILTGDEGGMLTDDDITRLLDAAARHDRLLDAIADRLLSGRPMGEGGARYKVKDGTDPATGEPVKLGLTDAATRTLALLREIRAAVGK